MKKHFPTVLASLFVFGSAFSSQSPAQDAASQRPSVKDMAPGKSIGDAVKEKPGVEQKPRLAKDLVPPAPPLTPEQALRSFTLVPGFRVELVAAEPMVEDPVDFEFDADGRLWVLEMRGYLNDIDGTTEAEPSGRIVILTDADGDGRMDQRVVFAENMVMPRALGLVGDGALVGVPPHLQWMRDTDGDGRADQTQSVLTGFGLPTTTDKTSIAYHPARGPNSPTWAMDNWFYFVSYTTRLRFRGGQFERGSTTYKGQWGLTQDDTGRLFFNTNHDFLQADLVPGHYLNRNANDPRPYGSGASLATTQEVWPARVNPGTNRAYREEETRPDGTLRVFTAACGPVIYRGSLFPPEYRGNAFIAEPAGNVVRRAVLIQTGDQLVALNAYDQREFLASSDERFRPVKAKNGPDGALYIADFYRGIIEHPLTYSSYMIQQIKDRDLDQHVHLGRIYRIVPENKALPPPRPQMAKAPSTALVPHLAHADGWWRDTAQRLLVERGDVSIAAALKALATSSPQPLARLHALWTLDGLSALDHATLITLLKDSDARVQAAAIRVSEPLLKDEKQRATTLAQLLSIATAPADERVRLQLVLTLGEAATSEADASIAALVATSTGSQVILSAAVSSLAGRESALLHTLLTRRESQAPSIATRKLLTRLAACAVYARQPQSLALLLDDIVEAAPQQQMAVIEGIISTSGKTSRRPAQLPAAPTAFEKLGKSADKAVAYKTRHALLYIAWPGKPGLKPAPPVTPLTTAEQQRYELGKTLFTGACAACHQPHGRGQPGLAPPLEDSEWVTGSTARLGRILIHGLYGPLTVAGQQVQGDMPAFGALGDEPLAALMTYLRREWGHTATPVTPEEVTAIRTATKNRTTAWIEEELKEVP